MSWLARLFRPHIELPAGYAERVERWRDLPGVSEKETPFSGYVYWAWRWFRGEANPAKPAPPEPPKAS